MNSFHLEAGKLTPCMCSMRLPCCNLHFAPFVSTLDCISQLSCQHVN